MPKRRTLEDVLREVKDDLLCYCVKLDFGSQDMGLDDTGESEFERDCIIVAAPGGFLGELRVLFQGTVADVKEMDLYRKPRRLSNPPTRDEMFTKVGRLRKGAFMYGTDNAVRDWPAKLRRRKESRG
jgi:hypothetical protein